LNGKDVATAINRLLNGKDVGNPHLTSASKAACDAKVVDISGSALFLMSPDVRKKRWNSCSRFGQIIGSSPLRECNSGFQSSFDHEWRYNIAMTCLQESSFVSLGMFQSFAWRLFIRQFLFGIVFHAVTIEIGSGLQTGTGTSDMSRLQGIFLVLAVAVIGA
jgi:hypothetical protein